MADNIDDGGPAFPVAEDHKIASEFTWTQGLSIRDYFAAAALRGLLNNESIPKDAAAFAVDAYRFADAMLEARKAKP